MPEDVRERFQQAGTVGGVRIVTDQFSGQSRGLGFVEMATREEAVEAVTMLNGHHFGDRNLTVDEAQPQPRRGRGGPRADQTPPERRGRRRRLAGQLAGTIAPGHLSLPVIFLGRTDRDLLFRAVLPTNNSGDAQTNA